MSGSNINDSQNILKFYTEILGKVSKRYHLHISEARPKRKYKDSEHKKFLINGLVPLIHLLNTTTRMSFEILFVTLIGAIVFAFSSGIQCLDENEKSAKCSGSCIQLR